MSACIAPLLPEVDRLVAITRTPQSLVTLQSEACRVVKSCTGHWQQAHYQLKELQRSSEISSSQKLQLATCERHFLSSYLGYQDHQCSYQTALNLISREDYAESLNLLASSAKCCASAGDFEQAISRLNHAFEWGWRQAPTAVFFPVFAAAVFVCNRMERHTQALACAEHCYTLAESRLDESELQVSQFKRLNSGRLAGDADIGAAFKAQLELLETGCLKYDLQTQYLLPVYAALEALDRPQPDCRLAGRALSMANERIADANDYALAQYSLALAHYHLAHGQRQSAINAIVEADCIMPEADLSLKRRIRRTLIQLDLEAQLSAARPAQMVSAQSWKTFVILYKSSIAAARNPYRA